MWLSSVAIRWVDLIVVERVGFFRQMIGALETVSRLCAVGLGLEEDALSALMHEGPHLLAPTGERECSIFRINPVLVGVANRTAKRCPEERHHRRSSPPDPKIHARSMQDPCTIPLRMLFSVPHTIKAKDGQERAIALPRKV